MSHALDFIKKYYELTPTGIIHVGANRGQEVDAYKASGIRPVVLIEPLPDPFARLVRAVNAEPGFHAVQACCSDQARDVEFHVASNGGQASSYLPPAEVLNLYPNVTFGSTVKFRTKTLDTLLDELAAEGVETHKLDYLAMDTQGSERDVLLGASKALENVNFVHTEVSMANLYSGGASVYEMIEFFRGRGFDLFNLLIRRKLWGDALFVRTGLVDGT
ncbi:FkbM family methyltransferase [Falsiroseomonas sp.]|uniref:FkbM family methyltransferase n=1 Tax=Falsiroseomonas sp. TaxID=2870721 RepID=UPI0034A4C707